MNPLNDSLFLREATLLHQDIISYENYPFSLPLVKTFPGLQFTCPVTYIVGENGSGKSTLLEAIATAWGFNPEGGSKNFRFSTRSSHSQELAQAFRLAKGIRRPSDGYFLRAESFFNVATEIESLDRGGGGRKIIQSYGGKSLHEQSHGESFYSLFQHRFKSNGFYILDEPEAALSPGRQFSFLARLHELVQGGSQFLIATHSPILMVYPDAAIWECTGSGSLNLTEYETIESVALYRDFLNNKNQFLKHLFSQ